MTIKKKTFLAGLLTLAMAVTMPATDVNAQSYNYNVWDESIPAPDAYEWDASIRGVDIGIDSLSGISDLFYKDGKLYIAMSGKVVITNDDFEEIATIESYKNDNGVTSVSSPTSLFVTDDGDLYMAEEALGKIVQFDKDLNWVRDLTDPEITGLEDVKYQPTKVVVDENGRIFVKAKSVYEGIIELDPDGNYSRFVGANEVSPDITEIIYRKFATDEQISRTSLWLPTDYSDICLDKDGFLMATVKDNESEAPIVKLNSAGTDIMNEYEELARPLADYKGSQTVSTLSTITAAEDGRFAALDVTRNRIFVYANDGVLAYELGGTGKQEGSLNSPVDVCFMGDKILVADLVSKTIEVFNPTTYGTLINKALIAQEDYDYDLAATYWEQVYDINPNLTIANMGLGKQALRDENFESAMKYFKACLEKESYSSAYERIREEWLNNNLGKVILIVILIIVAIKLLKKFIAKKMEEEGFRENKAVKILAKIKYTAFTWPGYMLGHPFKAFDDVKYENAGSTSFAVVIFVLFAWANLIKVKYSGFLVNSAQTNKINVPLILISCVVPYLIFVLANWAVGTLIDGKGNLNQVFKITAYAMYPTVWCYVIGSIISNWIIEEEALLVQFLFYLPLALFVFYCFVGIIMVHQFTFTKGLGSVLLSVVAMAIIIFIIVLLVTMVGQFGNDVIQIWDEFSLYYL